ncbi:MAG: hypothetical protein IJ533_05425 [Prevotella sp.]|nr:hypothetical protein [Prevotella sp.]
MRAIVIAVLMLIGGLSSFAQSATDVDSTFVVSSDSVLLQQLMAADTVAMNDTTSQILNALTQESPTPKKRDWATWKPNPQRALWLALVFPGGGQIYNRKYWKLPLVYGGFMGCIYALSWNNMMYKDYSQAYLDIMDDDPGTASYNTFMHLGRTIDSSNIERYKTIFKSRKDKYRRWRDMSMFVMIGVYALSVIDAYVDAELSVFDISKDLSLKVQPAVMGNPTVENPIYASSIGVNCKLNF